MTSGRAVLSDTTVARAGWASIVLGLVLVIVIQWTWPGVGVFRVVPEAVAGLTAMALGIIAIALTRAPGSSWRMGRAATWATLGCAILPTMAVVILALEGVLRPGSTGQAVAALIVIVGTAVTTGILVTTGIRLALAGVWYVWRNLVVAWGDRWVR